MTITQLLSNLSNQQAQFKDVLGYIEEHYHYQASAFKNGKQENSSNENQGSAKVLYFAKLENLNQEDTLSLFAEHFQAVLDRPQGEDHQNIRQFMENGWDGVSFESTVLVPKG
ncbi:HopJ type III effector protein [Sphingobacterium kyonggiense]|uniref:HopJ type III effector protein n=1 Tax=Sphingobacterium kyonggiense TaxID=714075 RepID=A0ABP7Y6B5_9SPHI